MIDTIIIHCSATPNGRIHDAADIHQWHQERGWDGIGYHYVIKIDGAIENGRPDYWQGAHASGHNEDSVGICLIGTDSFSQAQFRSLAKLCTKLKFKYGDVKIIGHNQVSDKTCPGFNVEEWVAHEF